MSISKARLRRSCLGIFLLLVLLCIAGQCAELQQFKIGLLVPLTGENQAVGQSIAASATAALPDVNEYLAAYGMEITLVEKDTVGDPATALTGLKALEDEGVRVVIGPALSSVAQHCLKYANSRKLTLLSPSSTSSALNKEDCLFRLLPPDDVQGVSLAKYISSVQIDEVLPVYINDSYGRDLEAAFSKAFKAQAGTILKGVCFKPEELTEPALVDRISEAAMAFTDPDRAAIIFIGYGDVDTFFSHVADDDALSQLRWFSSEALLASSPDFLSDETLSAFARQSRLTTVSIQPEDIVTDLYGLHIRQQAQAQLPQGVTLSHFAYPAWDALWIAADAVRRVETGDAASLVQAVTALGSGDAYYGMALLLWDKNGDRANGSYYILETNSDGNAWDTRAVCETNPNWPEPVLTAVPALKWPPLNSAAQITFHGLIPLSGELDLTTAKRGADLAAKHINQFFQLENINTTLEYVSHDTEGSPDVALATAQELYRKSAVPIFIGPCVSSAVESVASGLPDVCLISPTSTAPALAKSDDLVARLSATDLAQADALAALIEMDGVDRVVIVYRDDIWGQGIKTAFSGSFSGDTKSFAYGVDTTDFSDLIGEMEEYMEGVLAEKKAVLLVSFDEAATIFNQIDDNSQLLDYSWYGTDGVANIPVMLEDGPGSKAAQTGLRCSVYSPYMVDMLSPRLLLFNKWVTGSVHQAADPISALAYDSTWLAMFAYMLNNSSESIPTSSQIWSKLTEQASFLTGYSYKDTLDTNGDRVGKYYSFYRLEDANDAIAWKLVTSYMESGDGSKSLKRDGAITNTTGSTLSIKYKRSNHYQNGVPVVEKECDSVKAGDLPLGDFRIPENLITDNGVMTSTLSVFIDGNRFPCAVNLGDWQIADDLSRYSFMTSRDKMQSDYYPMELVIDQEKARWTFKTSKVLLDRLDWSDGVEVRIDVDRTAVVTLNFRPELQLKLSFDKARNGIDFSSQLVNEDGINMIDVSKLSACFSSTSPWKGRFRVSRSGMSTTDSFDPAVSGVALKANDNTWQVPAGSDWGTQTAQGVHRHSSVADSSKTRWQFDTRQEQWLFNATGTNTIGVANTLISQQGIMLELYVDETNKGSLLLKPRINAILHAK